jgi:hypothetical protein
MSSYQSGLLSSSVKDENMMLKLTLILSSLLIFASTECSSHAGNISSVPLRTVTTTWSVFCDVSSTTGGRITPV